MKVIEIINECADTTLRKHLANKEAFIKAAIEGIINSNKYSYFTSENGARNRMRIIGRDALIVELINGAIINREIQNQLGEARELGIGRNGYPETIQQAQNYIFNRISSEESPSTVYTEVQRSNTLCDFLISNYANLVATTTREQQEQVTNSLHSIMPDKLTTLNNLQNYLIDQNQTRMVEAQSQPQNSNFAYTDNPQR